MEVTGLIHSVIDEFSFTMDLGGKIEYFYLQKNMSKNFAKYLEHGTKVYFSFSNKKSYHHNVMSYTVSHFFQISKRNPRGVVRMFYDFDEIKNGIRFVMNKLDNVLFVDFEMNMQDYKPIPNFVQEIIEAGAVLTTKTGAIRMFKHWYIKPTRFKRISNRAMKFLKYDEYELSKAVSFKSFYDELAKINKEYHPYIVVWGKSDITTLKKCFEINNLPELDLNYVNLLQIIVNYENLKTQPGLFDTWERYANKTLSDQTHDSLEDAMVTKDVFFMFKERILK